MFDQKLQTQNGNERKNNFSFVFLFFGLVIVDQIIKFFVRDPFLNFNFAFSLPLSKVLIYLIYFFTLAGMFIYNYKNFSKESVFRQIAWVLIFAGALSNIGERIIFGYVKDFIYINVYNLTGIYNLADFYILFGVIILLVKD